MEAVGVDTESDSFFHYFEKVCLLQISAPDGRVGLVDPLAVRDLSALGPLMADPKVTKIFHAADNDVALLKRDYGFSFSGMFDTHVAARLCGRLELGLEKLLERELGVRLPKSLQRCDWSRRPLTPEQEHYAAEDVRHLFVLRDRLCDALRAAGREAWAVEESEALGELGPAAHREGADFRKAKGAQTLSTRQLAALRELFRARDEWARRADLPLFKLVGDEALVELAVRCPKDVGAIGRVRGLSERLAIRRGPEIVEAVRRAEAVTEEELRPPPRPQRVRMKPEACRRIDKLKRWRSAAAPAAGLDPGVLLPQRVIEKIAIDPPASLEALAALPGVRRWRASAFGPEILAALSSPRRA